MTFTAIISYIAMWLCCQSGGIHVGRLSTIINLIIQLIGGATAATGAAMKNLNLEPAGNTIAGALGGAAGGSLLNR